MAWIKTNFEGVWIFEPKIWHDQRGYFVETFNASTLPDSLQNIHFVQDNEANLPVEYCAACIINCHPMHSPNW